MSHNTWIHRTARYLIKPLVIYPNITPNHLTTVRLAIGLAAILLVTIQYERLSAELLFISIILDRADGELARLSSRRSHKGHKYDLVSDAIVNSLIFLGLSASFHGEGIAIILVGLAASISVLAVLWLVMRLENITHVRVKINSFPRFDLDDIMLVIPILMWLGLAKPLLYTASIGAPLFVAFVYRRFRCYF